MLRKKNGEKTEIINGQIPYISITIFHHMFNMVVFPFKYDSFFLFQIRPYVQRTREKQVSFQVVTKRTMKHRMMESYHVAKVWEYLNFPSNICTPFYFQPLPGVRQLGCNVKNGERKNKGSSASPLFFHSLFFVLFPN